MRAGSKILHVYFLWALLLRHPAVWRVCGVPLLSTDSPARSGYTGEFAWYLCRMILGVAILHC